jgi:LPS sulfotransferase NodH
MRSGSNEICSLLARNGLGSPNEFFQMPLSPDQPGTLLDSFARVVRQNQIEGVFGSKMSYDHRAALDEQLRSEIPGFRRIDDLLPQHRWVWLVRRDKILQAISWCRAENSSNWAATRSDPAKPDDLSYDFLHILSRLMMIYVGELSWETYFHENGIDPLIIVYEDFFKDLDRQLLRLINYLGGLSPGRPPMNKDTTFEIQRNERSYAVRQRFILDLTRIGEKMMAQELGEPYQRWGSFFFDRQWRI